MQIVNLIKNNKIVRFIFSGGISAVFHLTILYILVNYLDFWYLIASIVAFSFAVLVSFSLQKFFTFKDHSIKNIHSQFTLFIFIALFMLCLNTSLMYVFVDLFGFWYLFSQVFIAILTAFLNYFFFNKILFKDRRSVL